MTELRIGTCSWKYPSWEGLVYSAAKGINYLKEYANHYNTVEIDQWFWSLFEHEKIKLPKAAEVNEYRNSVSDDFRFTIKIPNSITLTHYYKKTKTNQLMINPHSLSTTLFQTRSNFSKNPLIHSRKSCVEHILLCESMRERWLHGYLREHPVCLFRMRTKIRMR